MSFSHRSLTAFIAVAVLAAISFFGVEASADVNDHTVIVDLEAEPPPLAGSNQPAVRHHISPTECTIVTANNMPVCVEAGQAFDCPSGLSAGAVHRTAPTYAETITPGFVPSADRDSHCIYAGVTAAFPTGVTGPHRPAVACTAVTATAAALVGLDPDRVNQPFACHTTNQPPLTPTPTAFVQQPATTQPVFTGPDDETWFNTHTLDDYWVFNPELVELQHPWVTGDPAIIQCDDANRWFWEAYACVLNPDRFPVATQNGTGLAWDHLFNQ